MKDPYPKDVKDTPATRRRTVYMFHKRVVQHPLMQAFDGPDAQASCGRRENTTVAPQALALLNDRFVRARAMDFAQRVEKEAGAEPKRKFVSPGAWRSDANRPRANWNRRQPSSTPSFSSVRRAIRTNRKLKRSNWRWPISARPSSP